MGETLKSRFSIVRQVDGFHLAGAFLGLWCFGNTFVDIQRYGLEQGYYWWFCNLALAGTAWGLLTKSRGWLTGFLSIASYTQVFWIVDNVSRSLMGSNLFGIVEFMYQPGMPMAEFLLSHYHYVTIPVCALALVLLPKEKNNSLKLVLFWNPFIFGVSYFAFPPVQNINCIHEPCLPGMSGWEGAAYSIGFWLICYALHIIIVLQMDRFFLGLQPGPALRQKATRIFAVTMAVFAVITVVDVRYKASIPKFVCSDQPGKVTARCGYTLDYDPNVMLLKYALANSSSSAQSCRTTMTIDGESKPMHQDVWVAPSKEIQLSVAVPYPPRDVVALIRSECSPSEREIARAPRNASKPPYLDFF